MSELSTLYRVAAGPQIGFGHLVRAVSLSRTLGSPPVVSLRGGNRARAAARRFGCLLTDRSADDALRYHMPSALVVDDPKASASGGWIRAARRHDIPVVSVVDRGVGATGADLTIDGGLGTQSRHAVQGRRLEGPRYMVLDPEFLAARRAHRYRRRRVADRPGSVAIILGGGAHAAHARALETVLTGLLGSERVRVARGFAARQRGCASADYERRRHAELLAEADVAVTAGGVGLYEACCLGVPTIAVAVAPSQRGSIQAFASCGAILDGGVLTSPYAGYTRRVAQQVLDVLADSKTRHSLSARALRVVDGRGGIRVVAALRGLIRESRVSQRGGR